MNALVRRLAAGLFEWHGRPAHVPKITGKMPMRLNFHRGAAHGCIGFLGFFLAVLSLRAETILNVATLPESGATIRIAVPWTQTPRFGFAPVRVSIENKADRERSWEVRFEAGMRHMFPGVLSTENIIAVPAGQTRDVWFHVPIPEPGTNIAASASPGSPSVTITPTPTGMKAVRTYSAGLSRVETETDINTTTGVVTMTTSGGSSSSTNTRTLPARPGGVTTITIDPGNGTYSTSTRNVAGSTAPHVFNVVVGVAGVRSRPSPPGAGVGPAAIPGPSTPMTLIAEVSGPGVAGPSRLVLPGSTAPNGMRPFAVSTALEPAFRAKLSALVRGAPNLAAIEAAQLPADWRVWSGFGGVVLTTDEYAALDNARRSALRAWVALGGQLCLSPVAASTASAPTQAFSEKLGAGSIVVLTEPLSAFDFSMPGTSAAALAGGGSITSEYERLAAWQRTLEERRLARQSGGAIPPGTTTISPTGNRSTLTATPATSRASSAEARRLAEMKAEIERRRLERAGVKPSGSPAVGIAKSSSSGEAVAGAAVPAATENVATTSASPAPVPTVSTNGVNAAVAPSTPPTESTTTAATPAPTPAAAPAAPNATTTLPVAAAADSAAPAPPVRPTTGLPPGLEFFAGTLALPDRSALALNDNALFDVVKDDSREIAWLSFFLIGFAVVVGPLNLFLFAPAKRRHRLFFTTPLIALGASLFLVTAIFLQDGTGGTGGRCAVAVLLPGENQAAVFQEQATRTGFLMSRTFPLADDIALAALPLDVPGYGGPESLLTRGAGQAGGDWFRSRGRQAQQLRRILPTRARIESVGAAPNGAPIVQSSLGTTLRDFSYIDENGSGWHAAQLPSGQRVTLEAGIAQWAADARELGGSANLRGIIASAAPRVPGRWCARGGATELAPIATLASINWNQADVLYIGDLETPAGAPAKTSATP